MIDGWMHGWMDGGRDEWMNESGKVRIGSALVHYILDRDK
jgi:hypothetical protein